MQALHAGMLHGAHLGTAAQTAPLVHPHHYGPAAHHYGGYGSVAQPRVAGGTEVVYGTAIS